MTSLKPLRPRSAAWLTLSALAFAPLLCAQPSANDLDRALQTLKRLVTDRNFRELGFETRGEVEAATLDVPPLRRYFITNAALVAFEGKVDPVSLLRVGGELLFPVRAGNRIRCFITMANRGKGWQAVSFGKAEIATALTSARASQSKAARLPAASFFAVDIQALSSYVLGWRSDGSFPGDKSNGNLFLWSVPIKGMRLPGPVGPQPAGKLLTIFRDEARKNRGRAPGAGQGPN